jgi:hypothetical protein
LHVAAGLPANADLKSHSSRWRPALSLRMVAPVPVTR